MATWPNTLPGPIKAGYAVDPDQAFSRTDFDQGPARQRQRFTAITERVSAVFRFKPSEMEEFREFWKTEIGLGSAWFVMELNIGSGIQEYEVRFVRPYLPRMLSGGNWELDTEIEVRDV